MDLFAITLAGILLWIGHCVLCFFCRKKIPPLSERVPLPGEDRRKANREVPLGSDSRKAATSFVPAGTAQDIAAVFPEIVSTVTKGTTASVKMRGSTFSAGRDIKLVAQAGSSTESEAESRSKLRSFLSLLKPEAEVRHRDIADRLTQGTGKWFLESREFDYWVGITGSEEENRRSRVLCCVGNPGVGKTGLACLSFESLHRLQDTDGSALAFVYCDHNQSESEQTPAHLIGSLLAQLTNMLSYNNPVMTELLKRHTEGRHLDRTSGIDYIRRIAIESSPGLTIRLGVDGFDELHKDHRISFLRDLARLSDISNIHFLFFGRDTGLQEDIKRSLFEQNASVAYFQITENLTVADRQLFLQDRLDEHNSGEEIEEDLRTLIMEKLAARDSTFLLTALQVREVLAGDSPAEVKDAMSRVSSDLERAYGKMLSRVSPKGLKLLHWVLFSTYPLTLKQLRFAYAIKKDMTDLDPKQHLPFCDCIKETVGLLVENRQSNTVRFAHSTIKDYLAKHTRQYFPEEQSLLATTCLTFLNFHALSSVSGRARFNSDGDLNPFFEYAAFQWGHHVRGAGDDEKTCNIAVQWLLSERMQQVHSVREKVHKYHFLSYVQPPSPLYEACYFGLGSPVAKLLELGQDVNALDSNRRGPLYSAVCQNRLAVVELLFKCQNLDINVKEKDGITPLHAASRLGHIDIVRLFLHCSRAQTVEINVQDRNGWTALSSAAKHGYKDIVELLLRHPDIDINVKDNDGWTALTRAVDGGHADIVRLLGTTTLMYQHREWVKPDLGVDARVPARSTSSRETYVTSR